MNSFELLRLPLLLEVSNEELDRHFDEYGKASHPDAGGSDEAFSQFRKAYETLKSPSGRIREALNSLSEEIDSRGVIPTEVMNHFSEVASVLEAVDAALRVRSEARSDLTRALAEAKIPLLKSQLEEVLASVLVTESSLIGRFAAFDEAGWTESIDAMAEVSRGLTFLEKWKAELQQATGKLFEALLGGSS